ncbi:hypothetical protein CEE67_02520 [Limosilactobacillus fermentum]|uniref:DUF6625 family protein n=1 Tax=Limosilactobacillus fermentum TaxID=1613 RepID=UPI000B4C625C|nr:DUF6625 family protein [Limosilactobacillus fermentum]OWP36079.1 hypothetical protein CEE67_02520 [Limosilactobacillus fermentum]
MKKCAFIVPYFGKFKNYFQLFLNSCSKNTDYTWLIITDNTDHYHYPSNVKKITMTFDKLVELIQSKFDFEITLDKPYKLCDFRPAYGYIFSDLIKGYDWWGHCDTDTIMGDLNHFITDEMLRNYDKLFCLGHFIMYKNTVQNNELFKQKVNGKLWYKHSFTTNKPTNFDEVWGNNTNINEIFSYFSKKIYERDLSLNFNPEKLSKFVKQTYYSKNGKFLDENHYRNKLIVWDNGKLLRYKIDSNNGLSSNEYMYVHLQNRVMDIQQGVLNPNTQLFTIIPNEFGLVNKKDLDEQFFRKIRRIQGKYYVYNTLQLDKFQAASLLLKRKLVKLRRFTVGKDE